MTGEKTETSDSYTNVHVNEKHPKLKIRLRLSRQDEALYCSVTVKITLGDSENPASHC